MLKLFILLALIFLILFSVFQAAKSKESFGNQHYTYGILICCYNRPEFLKKTLDSLKKSNLQNAMIYIIDDHSADKTTTKMIDRFEIPGVEIIKERNRTNLGINDSMIKGFTFLYPKCEFLVTIDSDVELKPEWLIKLHQVYQEGKMAFPTARDFLVTGFNCTSTCNHKIKKTYPN